MATQEKTIFEKIIAGEIPADLLYEDETCIAINDKYPKAPVHILVVPKKHIPSLDKVSEEDRALIANMVYVANKLAKDNECTGYRLQFNVGAKGGQVIFHLHLHLMGWR